MTLHRKSGLALFMMFMFLVFFATAKNGQSEENCNWPELCKTPFSAHLKNVKIAVIPFFPMSATHLGPRHERVFTHEFYSPKPTEAALSGWFSPENYLDIIRDAFCGIRLHHHLQIDLADQIGNIPDNADYVVLGAVNAFEAGSMATVSFDICLLKGKTFDLIGEKRFFQSLKSDNLPFISNYPIHMIGNHAVDYHPQRTALNLATYLALLNVLQWIDQGGK